MKRFDICCVHRHLLFALIRPIAYPDSLHTSLSHLLSVALYVVVFRVLEDYFLLSIHDKRNDTIRGYNATNLPIV
jgi:hypothetical protein